MDWSRRSAYDSTRYQTAKRKLQGYLGDRCAECGSDESLEFDHIDPATKEFSIMSRWNSPLEALCAELDKCQLLCAECHLEKSRRDKSVGHGEGKTGKRNCRCAACLSRKAEYMREYQARRKVA